MIYPVYSIRDKATAFMPVSVDLNDQSAIRNFSMAVNAGSGPLGFSPADFDLYKVGEFNDQSGEIKPVTPAVFLVNGASLVGLVGGVSDVSE